MSQKAFLLGLSAGIGVAVLAGGSFLLGQSSQAHVGVSTLAAASGSAMAAPSPADPPTADATSGRLSAAPTPNPDSWPPTPGTFDPQGTKNVMCRAQYSGGTFYISISS